MNALQDTYLYNGSTGANDLIGDVVGFYFSDDGTISGTVTDATTGAPIEGATVYATAYEQGDEGTRTTDANGRYEFDDVYPLHNLYGSYGLCFSKTDDADGPPGGYVDSCIYNLDIDGAVNTDVYAGETTTVDYALQPRVAVSGTISAGAADPSRIGFTLRVFTSTGDEVTKYGTFSAAGGHYRMSGLPASAHTVCISDAYNLDDTRIRYKSQCFNGKAWDGRSTPPADATPLAISAGHEQPDVDFALELSG